MTFVVAVAGIVCAGCGGRQSTLLTVAGAPRPSHHVDRMSAIVDAPSSSGAGPSSGAATSSPADAFARAGDTYELCLVGEGAFARRVCYMVARAAGGPACSVLRDSVDGVVGDRCAPPEDCEAVIQTLDAQFPGRSSDDLEYMPVADISSEPLQIVVLAPDRDAAFAGSSSPRATPPTWQKSQVGFAAAQPELRALAADFAARCK